MKKLLRGLGFYILGNSTIFIQRIRLRGKSEKIVYFVISQPNLTSRFALLSFFVNDSRFIVKFLVLPNLEGPESQYLSSFESNLSAVAKYPCEVIPCWSIETGFATTRVIPRNGFIFLEQFTRAISPGISLIALSRKGLLIYVPYGVMLSSSSVDHYARNERFFLWRVFLETTWHKENLNFIRGRRFEVAGTFSASSILPNKEQNAREVLWAPHWSIGNTEYSFSTFVTFAEKFLYFVKTNPHISFAIRPHQRLGFELENSGTMSIEEYNSYLNLWDLGNNSRVSRNEPFVDDFDNSLCIITDSVSFLFDYTFSTKPLLRLGRETASYNGLGEFICKLHQSASNFTEIEDFIQSVNHGVDRHAPGRQVLLNYLQTITPNSHVEIISRRMMTLSR